MAHHGVASYVSLAALSSCFAFEIAASLIPLLRLFPKNAFAFSGAPFFADYVSFAAPNGALKLAFRASRAYMPAHSPSKSFNRAAGLTMSGEGGSLRSRPETKSRRLRRGVVPAVTHRTLFRRRLFGFGCAAGLTTLQRLHLSRNSGIFYFALLKSPLCSLRLFPTKLRFAGAPILASPCGFA